MKKIAFSLLAFFAVTTSNSQDLFHADEINKNITPFHDAKDALSGITTTHLQNQAAWKSFTQQYPTWGATFDRFSKLPHRAMGTPITFTAGGNDPIAKAKAFISQSFSGFNLPMNELELTRNYNDGKYINVDFKQVHNGLEVLWSRISVRFSQDLKIILVGLDAHRNIPALNPTLTPADAISKAEQAILSTITGSSISNDMKIFPYPTNGKYEYRLVYAVNVQTLNENKSTGDFLTYVDANNGEIVYRQDQTKFFDAKVKGEVHPVNQYTPTENRPMKNMKVVVGGTTYYTDTNGVAALPTGPATATISMEGKWVKVIDKGSGTNTSAASYTHTFASSGDSSTFDTTVPHSNVRGVNVYYHVNEIHEYMKSKLPAFTTMDNPLPANVDITTATCNAFYNGTSINFYAAGGGCNAFSYIGDVMTHEYGHGISRKFFQWQGASHDNGAMGEGYSDTWANCILKTGIIGLGSTSPSTFIRRYDNVKKVYPQDIEGEVHVDGEIIAGAWWDVATNWSSVDSMGSLFASSYYGLANGPDGAEGQVFHDILIDALTYDDDNSNIYDGTPHFLYIVNAFAAHGIYLLSNSHLDHTPLTVASAGSPITINTSAVSDFPAFLGDVKMIYRVKGTTISDTILMTKSGTNYTCQFPASTAGDVFEYIFCLYDLGNNLSLFEPASSAFNLGFTRRNIPYYLLVGYNSYYLQNFDSVTTSTPDWVIGTASNDNATNGKWTVAIPNYTLFNGDTVQSAYDHTTGTGACAVTGNASSPGSNANTFDVDGGRTSLLTPIYDIGMYNKPVISYWRWFTNSQDQSDVSSNAPGKDQWKAWISYDNGLTYNMAERTYIPDLRWRRSVVIPDLSKGSTVKLMFVATDSSYSTVTGTLVDAAVDDIEILALSSSPLTTQSFSTIEASISPNPVYNEFSLTLPESGELTYAIYNTLGELVLSNSQTCIANSPIKVNASNLANGIYFLKLNVNGKASMNRFVVAR